ncbi:MAG TPA: ATP-grasp domain-containing protein [Lachnospiraceae bacterium]
MDYLEIEGKERLRKYGIPINESILLEGEEIPKNITYPCLLKGQILSGKRGKAGAVRVVKSKKELISTRNDIQKITINGKRMLGVIACDLMPIKEEYYLGMTLDTKNRKMIMIFTTYGGIDIEELAEKEPEKLLIMNCTDGFDENKFRKAAQIFEIPKEVLSQVEDIAEKLTIACFELDATTIEINPLAVLENGSVLALDSKLVIDDNGLYRQGDYLIIPRTDLGKSFREKEAKKYDLTYVEINSKGSIGTMAGGAGIGMATIDTICHYGGNVNNFLDLGGGVSAEKTYQAMKILLENDQIKSIFVNIFGGINNCADMAEGIERAYREWGGYKKIVIKSRGFNQEQGWQIYENLGFLQTKYGTTDEAVKRLLDESEEYAG